MPNLNNHGEQEELRKNPSERSNHIDMQQRCSLLDKKLKEIEGTNNLGSVDPRELCLVPDVVIPPKFKIPKIKINTVARTKLGVYRSLSASCLGDCTFVACRRGLTVQTDFFLVLFVQHGCSDLTQ